MGITVVEVESQPNLNLSPSNENRDIGVFPNSSLAWLIIFGSFCTYLTYVFLFYINSSVVL